MCLFAFFFLFFDARISIIIIITRERERERTREGWFFSKSASLYERSERERERERETCLSHATPSSSSVLSRVSVFSFTRSVSLLTEFLSRDYFRIYIARVSSYNESVVFFEETDVPGLLASAAGLLEVGIDRFSCTEVSPSSIDAVKALANALTFLDLGANGGLTTQEVLERVHLIPLPATLSESATPQLRNSATPRFVLLLSTISPSP